MPRGTSSPPAGSRLKGNWTSVHDPTGGKDLTPKEGAQAVVLFRAEVIGALVHRDVAGAELRAELALLNRKRFRPPG